MHRVSLLVSSAVLLAATTTATAVPTYHVLGEGFGIAGLLTYDSLTDLVNGSPSNNQLVSGSFGDAIGLTYDGSQYHVLGEGFGIAGLLTYDSLTDLVNGSPSNNQLVSGSFGDAIGLVAVEGQTNGNNNNAIPEPVTAALGLMGLGV